MASALNRVERLAVTVARLEPRLEATRRELHEAIVQAHSEGASMTVIAKVAGMTPERVRQLVRRSER